MQKLLSIIIPTYNKENTLNKCLSSFLSHSWDHLLDVLVVNDGSTDNSLDIMRNYKNEYPEIIQIIDKKNGNYGSTINAALPLAKGKFVKVLDADDWFDEVGFNKYMDQLQKTDADLVITHFMYEYASGKMEIESYYKWEYNKVYNFDSIASDSRFKNMFMHAVTYRTELLREHEYRQTEGVSYTDNEWIFYPMIYVKSVVFLNVLVYHYAIGLEGQTMAPEIFVKNVPRTQDFCKRMLKTYADFLECNTEKGRNEYLFFRLKWVIYPLYKIYLLIHSDKEFNSELIDDIDLAIKETDMALYNEMARFSIGHMFHFHYITYWRRYRIRIPRFFINRLMKKGKLGVFPL